MRLPSAGRWIMDAAQVWNNNPNRMQKHVSSLGEGLKKKKDDYKRLHRQLRRHY
jgi:hypothetical protein